MISSGLPSLAQLQQVYPRNSIIPVADIFRLCTQPTQAQASGGRALETESMESWTPTEKWKAEPDARVAGGISSRKQH